MQVQEVAAQLFEAFWMIPERAWTGTKAIPKTPIITAEETIIERIFLFLTDSFIHQAPPLTCSFSFPLPVNFSTHVRF